MKPDVISELRQAADAWTPPPVPPAIPHGDMPGDQIHIGESHKQNADILFPVLLKALPALLGESRHQRAVVAVCGGSGVGKSETASLLSFYLGALGIGSYILSGDNYPRRIPAQNDAERLRVFRTGGLRGLVSRGQCTEEKQAVLRILQAEERDADASLCEEYPWLALYQREGRSALGSYLGSVNEIDFGEVTGIISQFQNGAGEISLKRMGRTVTDLWYDPVDFSDVNILMLEWTHGNSNHLQGVDFPILLNSTPQETLLHRKARQRDGAVDSAFTTMVLELEQNMLEAQAAKAKCILSKSGELLSYEAYRRLMAQGE